VSASGWEEECPDGRLEERNWKKGLGASRTFAVRAVKEHLIRETGGTSRFDPNQEKNGDGQRRLERVSQANPSTSHAARHVC
jgi:hypothetical protein